MLAISLVAGVPARAQVQMGDIAIVRVNNNLGTDSFTWVALRDIGPDEQVWWTDASWGNSTENGIRQNWFNENSSDGTPLFTGGVSAGTTGEITLASGLGPSDQLFLYTGRGPLGGAIVTASAEQAGFVWAMTWGNPWLTSGTPTTALSYEPETVRNLGMAVTLLAGAHWYYDGQLSGTAEQIFAMIRDPANWKISDQNVHAWNDVNGGEFQVTVPEPSTYTLFAGVMTLALGLRLRSRRARSAPGN